ncbi:Stress responsive alpha-beta barrel [Phaffia rhodozyma]|uniref:Stress responsive alpha-beta barrel n=1 Tax=Phaffia rhodozyma TaxID=264483 RepID=A0A0F7SWH8_PHARH|nr:Stress responsive alpha-beta barrel [Phaffia rhodozyma]
MPIQHIVAFKYKLDANSSSVSTVASRFLELKERCVRSGTTDARYIVRLVGGKENSPEGMTRGLQEIFLVEFENDDDRQYYLHTDPAHDEFKKFVTPLVQEAVILDFNEGSF